MGATEDLNGPELRRQVESEPSERSCHLTGTVISASRQTEPPASNNNHDYVLNMQCGTGDQDVRQVHRLQGLGARDTFSTVQPGSRYAGCSGTSWIVETRTRTFAAYNLTLSCPSASGGQPQAVTSRMESPSAVLQTARAAELMPCELRPSGSGVASRQSEARRAYDAWLLRQNTSRPGQT